MALKEKLIDKAQKLIQKGYYDKAVAEYRAAADVDPRDISIRLRIGDLFVKLGRNSEAVKEYTEAAKANAQRGFYLKAIAVYKQALKFEDSLEVHNKLAELYTKQRLIADAISEYSHIVNHFERRGRTSEVLELLKKMVDVDPDNIGVRLRLAEHFGRLSFEKDSLSEYAFIYDKLVSQGKYDRAEKIYLGLYNLNPSNESVISGLCDIYRLKGDSGQQVRFMKVRMSLQHGSGRTVEAAAMAAEIDAIAPGDPEAAIFLKRARKEAAAQAEAQVQVAVDTSVLEADEAASAGAEPLVSWPEQEIEVSVEGPGDEAEQGEDASDAFAEAPVEIEIEVQAEEQAQSAQEVIASEDAVAGAVVEEVAASGPTPEAQMPYGEVEIDLDNLPHVSSVEVEAAPEVEVEVEPAPEVEVEVEPAPEVEVEVEPAPEVEVEVEPFAEAQLEQGVVTEAAGQEPLIGAIPELDEAYTPLEQGAQEAPDTELDPGAPVSEEQTQAPDIELELNEPSSEEQQAGECAAGQAPESPEIAEALVAEQAGAAEETVHEESLPLIEELPQAEAPQATPAPVEEDYELQEDLSSAISELMEKIEPAAAQAQAEPAEQKPARPEEYVDLSAELGMEEALNVLACPWGGEESREAFDEFKSGIGEQLSKEDSETHYNLGIAYMEMELYSEASKEFKIALKDHRLEFDCYTRLGLCAVAAGEPNEAITYYLKGLKVEGRSIEERVGIMYELGLAYEAAGDAEESGEIFKAIYDLAPSFREIARKVEASMSDSPSAPLDDGLIEVELL